MHIDVSIKYQVNGIFDPDDLSNNLGIMPDSIEKIGDYQRRFSGLPTTRVWTRAKPFVVASWDFSIRKDIDVVAFNALFDYFVSAFNDHNVILKNYECQNDHEFKALEHDEARRITITIRSVQSGYFYIDPRIVKKSLNICDEIVIYFWCDVGHDEGNSDNISSKFYIKTPLIKRKLGGIVYGDASPIIGKLKAAVGGQSLEELSCYYYAEFGGGIMFSSGSLKFLSTVREKINMFVYCVSREHNGARPDCCARF